MQACRIDRLYDLKETIAAELFAGAEYPWEVLPKIKEFIVKLGNSLPEDRYEKRGENISPLFSKECFLKSYLSASRSPAAKSRCPSSVRCTPSQPRGMFQADASAKRMPRRCASCRQSAAKVWESSIS